MIGISTLTAQLHYFRFMIFNVLAFFCTKYTDILEKSCYPHNQSNHMQWFVNNKQVPSMML